MDYYTNQVSVRERLQRYSKKELMIPGTLRQKDNVLRLRQEREGNQASAESQVDETTLYIEAASGAKKRNLYGAGSKRVDYIKDKDSGNETTGITKVNDGWEKKSMKMERKLNKLNKTLEIVCNRFNITLPDCDSDSENTDGGDAHQRPNTSNSRAGESNSQAGEREEDDHDSRMISNDNSSVSIVNFELVGAENNKMKESHRCLHSSVFGNKKSQSVAFVVNTNSNTNNINRRVNSNINNTNKAPNPNLLSKNYGLIGHTVDMCYELIGYPAGFKRYSNMSKQSGNTKRFNGNSEVNQFVPSTSGSFASSFTSEQIMKLLSLINEKPYPSANMSDMLNIVDISNLMLTVGHPNGTLAKITAIGILKLTSGIVLFDVLVDLKLGKTMRTGSETGGLYFELWHCRLGHLANQVLFILGKQLGFSKSDHISSYDICHKAKHTREPFPLSDHKSKFVGDIIHCDVWGLYRVVSKDRFKYFLSLVDDFSRAVWVHLLKLNTQVGDYVESFIKVVFT
ncbi:ribonuclease H-like domain-containing protein [Tanacetum coccineum]